MQSQKRKTRNIFVRELDSDVLRRRINGLTKADGGVNFYFELKNLDDEFLEFAIDLTDKLLEKGVSVAVSNSNTEFIRNLYNPKGEMPRYVYKILIL